jgi:hypothetical protein
MSPITKALSGKRFWTPSKKTLGSDREIGGSRQVVRHRGQFNLKPWSGRALNGLIFLGGSPHSVGVGSVSSAIELFLRTAKRPVALDPGEQAIALGADNLVLTARGASLTLECWSETRNLSRRVRGVRAQRRGRLELEVERFGGRPGTLLLVDVENPANSDASRRGARLQYRERFRRSLLRQFAGWKLAELSTEQDLHHSLSPSYPRALLRRGATAWAAIGAGEDALDPDGALSFGLIWLDYLRRREQKLGVEGLLICLPEGTERTTCHRVRHLDPGAAQYRVFVQDPSGYEQSVEPGDYTNFETRLEPFRRAVAEQSLELEKWVRRIGSIAGVEVRERPGGAVSLLVRGLEFARTSGDVLLFGLDGRHVAGGERHVQEIERLALGLARMRSAEAENRTNPLYTRRPEAWLESMIRADPCKVDALLCESPVYAQAPELAAGERGIVDLLGVDRDGRLAVIEIKASQDIHLPLQALDYWMHVRWHLERGEFAASGYFPGIPLSGAAPRLFLVAPALEFHPANEVVLRFLAPGVPVERVGVGLQWRQDLRVMFRGPVQHARHEDLGPNPKRAGQFEPG